MIEKKKKKRKIRLKGLLVIILLIYLILSCGYLIWKMPIKNIEIKGNYFLKDNYIIAYLNIENQSIFRVSKSKIKKKLLNLDLISSVKVHKNYLGKITIDIVEDKILFYNKNEKKIILSSGKKIDYADYYLGVPVLINYVPDNVYEELIKKLDAIDQDVIALISEIEYNPSIINGKTVDNKRFLFRMNDGNKVYINTINIEKFNNYLDIYEAIINKNGNVKGCLYLDSAGDNNHFNNCETPSTNPESE